MKMIALIVLMISSLVRCQEEISPQFGSNKKTAIKRGLFCGIAGGLAAHYPNAIKNKLYQDKRIFTYDAQKTKLHNIAGNCLSLTRGIGIFTASITLGTLTQTPLKETIQTVVPSALSKMTQEFSSLAIAGMLSAAFVCPADYYLIKQQNTGLPLKKVIRNHSLKKVFSAVGITGCREIFSAAFLISNTVADYVNIFPEHKILHSLGGSIPVAIVSASLSAPLDKIKTCAQSADISTKEAFKRIYSTNGIKRFVSLKELAGRNAVFLAAIPPMSLMAELIKN
ncbi:hypothetical protein Noda2021_03200 [Candidatus Dependentiae bacterium Noda2021]|nr:hypothetical protein Noda2021_03200 [Candidatus Dependentiae bacterium Noda2021]